MMGPFRATWDEEDVQCIGKKRRTDISLPSTKAACFARNLHNDSVSTRMCIRDEMCVELEIARGIKWGLYLEMYSWAFFANMYEYIRKT